eukprot:Nk52_evm35s2367 gene=Nk52_evmTU35s2367
MEGVNMKMQLLETEQKPEKKNSSFRQQEMSKQITMELRAMTKVKKNNEVLEIEKYNEAISSISLLIFDIIAHNRIMVTDLSKKIASQQSLRAKEEEERKRAIQIDTDKFKKA